MVEKTVRYVRKMNYSAFSVTRLASRMIVVTSRRRSMASAVNRPCRRAFLFPFGAPVDSPPCNRHLPFAIAADRQGAPARVFAPQGRRGGVGDPFFMGLFSIFSPTPTRSGFNKADDGLPAGVDVNMFNRNLLLAFAPMPVQRIEQLGEGPA